MSNNLEELLEQEWCIVRYSGETPEIAFNSAIYYLTRAAEGPHLELKDEQVRILQNAAVERYREIIVRDLDHANRDKAIYRGVARSICNYERYCKFCNRQQLDPAGVKKAAALALQRFLLRELELLESSGLAGPLNCSFEELKDYAALLQVDFGQEYVVLEKFCYAQSEDAYP